MRRVVEAVFLTVLELNISGELVHETEQMA